MAEEKSVDPMLILHTQKLYMGIDPHTGESLPSDHPAVLTARANVEKFYKTTYDSKVDVVETKRTDGLARTLKVANDRYQQSDEYAAETGHRSLPLHEYAKSETPANPQHLALAKEIDTLTRSKAYLDPQHEHHDTAMKRVEWLFGQLYG